MNGVRSSVAIGHSASAEEEAERLGLPWFVSGLGAQVAEVEEQARAHGLYASVSWWDDVGAGIVYARPELDPNTGLPNWAALYEELDVCARGSALAVIAADVVGMTERARQHGQDVADGALKAAVAALVAARAPNEFLASYRDGGDEFILVLPDCTQRQTNLRLHELRTQLSTVRAKGPSSPVVELLYGAATRRDNSERPRSVLDRALRNLHTLKRQRQGAALKGEGKKRRHP